MSKVLTDLDVQVTGRKKEEEERGLFDTGGCSQ